MWFSNRRTKFKKTSGNLPPKSGGAAAAAVAETAPAALAAPPAPASDTTTTNDATVQEPATQSESQQTLVEAPQPDIANPNATGE